MNGDSMLMEVLHLIFSSSIYPLAAQETCGKKQSDLGKDDFVFIAPYTMPSYCWKFGELH